MQRLQRRTPRWGAVGRGQWAAGLAAGGELQKGQGSVCRAAASPAIHSAPLLLLITRLTSCGDQWTKFPPEPGLWLCFYLCNGVRRYLGSQIKNREQGPAGGWQSKALGWGSVHKHFVWVKAEKWKRTLLHVASVTQRPQHYFFCLTFTIVRFSLRLHSASHNDCEQLKKPWLSKDCLLITSQLFTLQTSPSSSPKTLVIVER